MSINICDRILYIDSLFKQLSDLTSPTDKRILLSTVRSDMLDDFYYCIECVQNTGYFGFTYDGEINDNYDLEQTATIKDILLYLQEPRINKDLSRVNIYKYVNKISKYWWFFEKIVNKTLRIGIGKSLLKRDFSPMLAKKFQWASDACKNGFYVTEKLDGNRCIAIFTDNEWQFISRNGKRLKINIDMYGMPKEYVYDGELLSTEQTKNSIQLNLFANGSETLDTLEHLKKYGNFNETSGVINNDKITNDLVYNIFDIMLDETPYYERRNILDRIDSNKYTRQVRILPLLNKVDTSPELNDYCEKTLDRVVALGGEGLMINNGDAKYYHVRTNKLLKLKDVQTIDMRVLGVNWGKGKYQCLVGSLECYCRTDDGKDIFCQVGSGLSDEQREQWIINPEIIIGKIIEVAYFSLSKNKDTLNYSLRFPRLKRVRTDKSTTSEY